MPILEVENGRRGVVLYNLCIIGFECHGPLHLHFPFAESNPLIASITLPNGMHAHSRIVPWLALIVAITAHANVATGGAPSTTPPEGLRDATPTVYALVGGRLVAEPGKVVENGTIVIQDGLITAVAADLAPPAGARQVQLKGMVVYPGFIDAYSEVDWPTADSHAGTPYWNSQVTPEHAIDDVYQPNEELDRAYRSQGIAARLVAPKQGIIKGTSAVVLNGGAAGSRSIVRGKAALHLRLTIPYSDGERVYPNSPMGAVALARQALYDAQWYGDAWTAYESSRQLPRPERNDSLAAMREHVGQARTVMADAPNELFALRADAFAREFALPLVIRGSGNEYRRLDDIRLLGRPVILPLDFPDPPDVSSLEAAARVQLEQLMHWQLAPENPARVTSAGIPTALTAHGLETPKEFLDAIRAAVKRGLDPAAALEAITTSPARILGISDRLGTIAVGQIANLVVTNGEIFAAKTCVISTWIDGEEFKIKRKPAIDPRGRWRWTFAENSPHLADLDVTIEGSGKKLKGRAAVAGAAVEDEADHNSQPDNGSDSDENGNDGEEDDGEEDDGEEDDGEEDDGEEDDGEEDDGEEDDGDSDQDDVDANQFKTLSMAAGRLTGSFGAHILAQDGIDSAGVVQISAILTDSKPRTMQGFLQLPDGSRVTFSGERLGSVNKGDKAEGDGNGEEEEDVDQADPNKGRNGDGENGDGENGDGESGDGESGDGENDDGESASEPYNLDINYPLGAFGVATPAEPRQGTVVLQGATVWTCGPAGTIDDATVVVVNGRITNVGRRNAVTVPPSATVIDVAGKQITPGIIDCHSHMATDGGINESGQAVTAEVRIGDFVDCDDINIYRQLAGGVTMANILHGSANPIGGQNQVIKLRWGMGPESLKCQRAPAGIKFALGENVKQSNWGDGHTTRYPQTRMGVEQIILDEFRAAQFYARSQDQWQRNRQGLPPRRDLELEAIAEILGGERWIHCHSYRQDEILALIRTLDGFGIKIGTFQHILEGYKVAPEMARHGAMGSAFADWWAYKFEVYDAIPFNGALMHDAGIVVSFNSDDQELARHLNHEAAKAVKYGGVPPEEALKFVTLNPARQLRIDEFAGSLEVGKDADLVVWSGPPLSVYSRCEQTWIDGIRYFDLATDQQMRQRARTQHAELVQRILADNGDGKPTGTKSDDTSHLWPRFDRFCGHGRGP